MTESRLLVLCSGGGYDALHRALGCAAAAAHSAWQVDVVFYDNALRKLQDGTLDELSLDPRDAEAEARLAENLAQYESGGPAQLLESLRLSGRARVFACSASCARMGLSSDSVLGNVDEIIGWPTVLEWMRSGARVLQF